MRQAAPSTLAIQQMDNKNVKSASAACGSAGKRHFRALSRLLAEKQETTTKKQQALARPKRPRAKNLRCGLILAGLSLHGPSILQSLQHVSERTLLFVEFLCPM